MKPETQEIATTLDGRDITRGYLSPLMVQLPDDTVLIQRGGGDYSLYREVLRDDHVKAALQQRFNAVVSQAWSVKPGGDKRIDKQAADFLRGQLERLCWDEINLKMLHGVFYGHAVGEVLWGREGNQVVIADIKVRDRRRFGYDGAGRLRLKTFQDPMGELLPERKFWTFATGADHDDAPYGLGLAHWLYWPVWLKRNGVKFWSVFLEKFGSPTARGTFPPSATPAEQAKLLSALQAIQRDSAIIFPDGMDVGFIEATRGGTADHQAFIDAMNKAILVIAIGQTATTSGTAGKLGSSDEQQEVREDLVKADADLVCMSFNATVAKWLTEWNFPGAAVPQVWRDLEQQEDLKTRAERDKLLAEASGFKPSLKYIINTYGGEWEASMVDGRVGGAKRYPPNNPPNTPPQDPAFAEVVQTPTPARSVTAASGSKAARTGETDAALSDALSRQSAPAWNAILDQLRHKVMQATSLESLRDDLLAAYADLPQEELVKIMEAGFAVADLAGRFEVSTGQ